MPVSFSVQGVSPLQERMPVQPAKPAAVSLPRFSGKANRRTGIVASLGPSSLSEPVIRDMIRAGADVFRINFAKGTHQQHAETTRTVRRVIEELRASGELKRPVRMMADLQGPRLAIGILSKPIAVNKDDEVSLLDQSASNSKALPVAYPGLAGALKKDNTLILNDGEVVLKITGPKTARVIKGGEIRGGMTINAPDVDMEFPALTEKDRADLAFALKQGFEIITQSFPASAADIRETRRLIQSQSTHNPMLIAKIERPQTIEPKTLRAMAKAADALMVARGDLGTEMGLVRLPRLQQKIIDAAHREGKQVVVANKLLGTMVDSDQPGRSDVFDVAHAVTGGADMIMLTTETAAGQYPVEAVRVADAIVREYEPPVPPGRITTLARRLFGRVFGS